MDEAQVIRALGALAQETRLRLFRLLVVAGPQGLTPGSMAETLGASGTVLSFHLKELHAAGLVQVQRQGRHQIYRAAITPMNELLSYLTAHCCQGEFCLEPPLLDCTASCSVSSTHQESFTMSKPSVYNVLFICTHNSARSIMAEALLNQLGAGKFRAYSAGSRPASHVHPQALALLQRHKIPTEGLRSKNWEEFAQPDAPQMDFVLTVCDQAAGETCPLWPGQPMSAHWGLQDPASVPNSPENVEKAFSEVFRLLHRRISLFLSLPLTKLDQLSLQKELRHIGSTSD
jgi:protein-tyrosine-phosphatase/DNA-binding transcriptional ArsR family regulator